MPLVTGRSKLSASASWVLTKTNTGFAATSQTGSLSFTAAPDAATYTQAFSEPYTINAAETQIVDFRGAWTNDAGESVTATKILGFLIKVTGSGGVLKFEPGASNPLPWPFTGTAPDYVMTPSTGGAAWLHCDGTHATVDGSNKTWLLTNTGAAAVTVYIVAFVGTA